LRLGVQCRRQASCDTERPRAVTERDLEQKGAKITARPLAATKMKEEGFFTTEARRRRGEAEGFFSHRWTPMNADKTREAGEKYDGNR